MCRPGLKDPFWEHWYLWPLCLENWIFCIVELLPIDENHGFTITDEYCFCNGTVINKIITSWPWCWLLLCALFVFLYLTKYHFFNWTMYKKVPYFLIDMFTKYRKLFLISCRQNISVINDKFNITYIYGSNTFTPFQPMHGLGQMPFESGHRYQCSQKGSLKTGWLCSGFMVPSSIHGYGTMLHINTDVSE